MHGGPTDFRGSTYDPQTDRQRDGQTDGQTNGQTYEQTDGKLICGMEIHIEIECLHTLRDYNSPSSALKSAVMTGCSVTFTFCPNLQ